MSEGVLLGTLPVGALFFLPRATARQRERGRVVANPGSAGGVVIRVWGRRGDKATSWAWGPPEEWAGRVRVRRCESTN